MNLALWIAQGILAFAFMTVGVMKVFAYERFKALSEKNGPTSLTRGLTTFIGIAEISGGVGVILPMAVHIAPQLTGFAAAGLTTIMLLAIGFHVRRRESPGPTIGLFVLALFVAVGRLAHRA